ncbi:MAG: efflux RND transporter periplasmic adaptor subunit [Planctomycetia bacterium]|nr:efflux RND transporter periplasmic adaptor subunit [Planctomycetia bacterium]
MFTRTLLAMVWLAPLLAAGCRHSALDQGEAPPPVVTVSQPVKRDVTDYIDYTGRTDSVNTVDVRARVTGYLVKMPFKEGSEVKKNDLLFEVDPRPYKAQLDQAEGQLELAKARLKLAKADNARAKVIAQTPGAISKQDLDKYEAAEEEAMAEVAAATANLETYKLNLDFCEVISPIDGLVSRYFFTLGNLVNQDQTLLTTVVSLDPMYAYFDVDERTLLRVRNAINAGKLKPVRDTEEIAVLMGLQGEEGYPHQGVVNFVNNKVDPFTGTITLRGVFANPKPETGVRLLSAGLFVRIRLPLGEPHPALLVTDRAIGTDQGLKFIYVVDADNTVQYRRVTLGALQDDGLRVVTEGLKSDDWVVVAGLQQVRPKMVVSPERVEMPVPVAEADQK